MMSRGRPFGRDHIYGDRRGTCADSEEVCTVLGSSLLSIKGQVLGVGGR